MADERVITTPPEGAEGWRRVWQEDRSYPARPSKFDGLLRFVRRLVVRASEPEAERQKNYNLVLLDLLQDVRNEIAAARRDARADLDALQADVRRADESLSQNFDAKVRIAASRGDALAVALDQKIETIAARLRDVTNPILSSSASLPSANDILYRRLEDGLRGTDGEIREAVAPYVDLAAQHQPVIDVGCGRGEFLVACRERGIDARGFDVNERSVSDLRQRGLRVDVDAIPHCFSGIADGSVGSILAMHVVEHLPVDALFALYREAARVLKAGGLLMIETPNAESILVSASEFWRDPTHLAPRHPASLTLLGREYGFAIDDVRAVHPLPDGVRIPLKPDDPPQLQRVIEAINDRLFAPQDLRMVLRKV